MSETSLAVGRLRSFIERLERLEEEKQGVQENIKEVLAEAKGEGFDTGAIKTLVKLRKKDPAEIQEEESILGLYREAIGV